MILPEKQQQLRDDLEAIHDPHERLGAVIDRSRRRPALPASERTDANRVRGCVSSVWLIGELRHGRCYFRSDADGPVVKGLVALLCDFFSEATPAEIVASDHNPIETLDLTKNLSPTRRNGLASALAAIRAFAQDALPKT
ncbi:MAG TPA: SufE family protein [Opitutaceae bacterium]|nr:SufE family protein [Opitutaceae bacterium]